MKPTDLTTAELEAYLDESLPIARMAAVEEALRRDPQLLRALETINGRRDAGVHSLGEIWRRNRLSCPTRQQLGNYLLGILDLQSQQAPPVAAERRRKYLQSSAGHLKRR
jgi:hypothetical protein